MLNKWSSSGIWDDHHIDNTSAWALVESAKTSLQNEFKRVQMYQRGVILSQLVDLAFRSLLLITIKMIQPSNVQCLLSEMTQTECGCEKTDKRQTVGNRGLASFCQMLSVSDW